MVKPRLPFTIHRSLFTMDLLWWLVAIILMAIGLIGMVVPVLPGAVIIFAAAVVHQVMLGTDKSLGWWNVAVLGLFALLSYAIEVLTGYFGAKKFGATKWGITGAAIGALVGLFFPFPGLIIGPVVGAIGGELLGGKRLGSAGRAGWGTLLGGLIGMVAKLAIGLIMISWFLVSVQSPF